MTPTERARALLDKHARGEQLTDAEAAAMEMAGYNSVDVGVCIVEEVPDVEMLAAYFAEYDDVEDTE